MPRSSPRSIPHRVRSLVEARVRCGVEHAVRCERARTSYRFARHSLRGFVALAKERYHKALKLFRWAGRGLSSVPAARRRPREQIVVQIAALEVALQSADVLNPHAGTCALPSARRRAGGPRAGCRTHADRSLDSWLDGFEGDRDNAYDRARISDRLAPSPAWLTWSLANVNRGGFRRRGVRSGVRGRCRGNRRYRRLGPDGRRATRRAPLARGSACRDEGADGAERPGALRWLDVQDRSRALRRLRRASFGFWKTIVSRSGRSPARGGEAARHAFTSVHATASRVGILWGAALALIELDATPSAERSRGERYLQDAGLLIRSIFRVRFSRFALAGG